MEDTDCLSPIVPELPGRKRAEPDTEMIAIRELATRFRRAIESLNLTERGSLLNPFPRGACGETTSLLGTYLRENGCGSFAYVCGQRPSPGDHHTETHAWLRRTDLIVDITADQFPEVDEPVIVTRHSPWHEGFDGRTRGEADYRNTDEHSAATRHELYVQIVARAAADS